MKSLLRTTFIDTNRIPLESYLSPVYILVKPTEAMGPVYQVSPIVVICASIPTCRFIVLLGNGHSPEQWADDCNSCKNQIGDLWLWNTDTISHQRERKLVGIEDHLRIVRLKFWG